MSASCCAGYQFAGINICMNCLISLPKQATIKNEVQKDKEFAIVGRKFGRFSHRRKRCLPFAQVKRGGILTPYFLPTEKLPINEKNRYFWRAILMVARHVASI
jgi:hypothetical protein